MFFITLQIISLFALILSCIGILGWIFRPNSKEIYKEYSQLALRTENKEE